ncbi:magnesium/cobalt transporter CorA [Mucilaginibacter gotjawali]|uniref:Magnesium transporter n=2 Tax=Mucilaginibacter gotjawali TaxID=1550579 RepID=A0A839SC50_9SPHI|nr:magnesium/cobalt transporter CorA [Mucilaginibacter gotjawali]MBB3055178.1 magnesium transporter [Mucilaginibacter gotjawali]BAU56203.1 Magnesium transport protein CorA [Mucilaginibacter gotjawali]
MKKPLKRIQYNPRRRAGVIGESPGVVIPPEDALKPLITIFSYNAKELVSSEGKDIKVIFDQFKKCSDHTHWIQVRGLGDATLIEEVGAILNINPLVLEDIANVHQRPKFDDYDDYIFAVSRMISFSIDYQLVNLQFSALVKDNIIITFEETHKEHFEGVKNRLAAGKGAIRTAGAGYMCYALTDTILDRYFALLAQLGEQLDEVEDRLYDHADKSIMYETQQLKRTLIVLRRACWPERDKINDMLRTESPLISPEIKMFLKDAYDHCIQIMDLVEGYKEITSSIMDIYLSMVSNRMNEIMKVLTIISVIFIPLTFIAGVYGMNFSRVDPVTNKVMPDNLPELYNPHGYFYALGGMLIIGIIQVVVFWKKGWFSKL